MVGQTFGHYRVDERIGAGGMGVVYRAYDTRLHRTVAIKVISDPDVTSEVARRRLLSEARTASALNHPNICTVHDVGEFDDRVFLVMEFVEGQRLDALIPQNGLPIESVLRHGIALADALDHAHAGGILHRDLKSANVVVTPAGVAKILDFGIARRAVIGGEDATRTPETHNAAHVTGTLAYMSPEVLAGQPATAQSDIWSLGVLLFEMALGTLPFSGRSAFELTAAILREPVHVPDSMPAAIGGIIGRCLAKEPGRRYATSGEVRAALETAGAHGSGRVPVVAVPRRSWGWFAIAAATAGLAAVIFWPWLRGLWVRAPLGGQMPAGQRLTLLLSSDQRIIDPVLSPDGRMIAYVLVNESGRHDLFVSQVSGTGRVQLTDDAAVESGPRFSPDGQRLAFTRRVSGATSICLVATLGGPMATVISSARDTSWSPDGGRLAFVYRPDPKQPPSLATAGADGSAIRPLYTAPGTYPFIRSTVWSPDGRQIAFVLSAGGVSSGVWLIPAGGGAARRLSDDPVGVISAEPLFSPDGRSVLLSSNRGGATNLWSLPVAGGQPVQLTNGPGPDESPSIAADGLIAFLNSRWRSALAVSDLGNGESRTLLTHSAYVWAPALSPDGQQIAFSRAETDGLWHIWVTSTAGGSPRQLTFGSAGEIYPRFTPDGQTILFHTWGSPRRIWKTALAGGPPVAITPEGAPDESWADTSPDGRWLAFVRVERGAEYTYVASLAGGAARLLSANPATTPRWSPDGTRLAVGHDRSYEGGVSIIDADGRNERRLTKSGGWPVWWPDGRSLAFMTVGEGGDQEIRRIDLEGRHIPFRAQPRFVGTNHLVDFFRDGSSMVSSMAVHLSDEVWLLRR